MSNPSNENDKADSSKQQDKPKEQAQLQNPETANKGAPEDPPPINPKDAINLRCNQADDE